MSSLFFLRSTLNWSRLYPAILVSERPHPAALAFTREAESESHIHNLHSTCLALRRDPRRRDTPTASHVRTHARPQAGHRAGTPQPHIGDTPRSRSRRSHRSPHTARAAQPRSARTPLATLPRRAPAWQQPGPAFILVDVAQLLPPHPSTPSPLVSLKGTPQHSSRGNDGGKEDTRVASRHLQRPHPHPEASAYARSSRICGLGQSHPTKNKARAGSLAVQTKSKQPYIALLFLLQRHSLCNYDIWMPSALSSPPRNP
ncbi:hypothetical protein C8J57DRAFT_1732529 [Mycena rebaudengoi]|nr:hypothetical protein C8J57DRAFT_1732529 [Mycena rebaudengoi]